MRVADVLAELDRAPLVSLTDLAGAGGIVVLAPHPDDEMLGCGGLIAAATDEGRHAEIVFLTDGSASHPGSRNYPPRRLARIRQDEAQLAAATLGVPINRVTFLEQPDAAAPKTGLMFEEAIGSMLAACTRAAAMALFVTWEHDPHCDHEAAAFLAGVVQKRHPGLRVWRYPIWGRHRAPDDAIDQRPWRGARLDVSRWLDRKRQALACHASQFGQVVDDDPSGFQLDPEMVEAYFGNFERFIGDAA